MKKTIYFFILIFFASCENIKTVDAPWDAKSIPVVFSILSPNEPVQVYLNKTYTSTSPITGNPYPEARVFICGADSNWKELTRLRPDTCIFVDVENSFTVEKGKTYSLKIELENAVVRAQAILPAVAATIESAICTYKPEEENVSYHILINHEFVPVNGFPLKVKCITPTDKDYGYDLTAFSNARIGFVPLIDNTFISNSFPCPKDSATFMLRLHTLDPKLKKFLTGQSIIEMEDFGGNPVLAIIQKFGGVLPQFSNIVNGVGLFSSYVTDSVRVSVTNYPQEN